MPVWDIHASTAPDAVKEPPSPCAGKPILLRWERLLQCGTPLTRSPAGAKLAIVGVARREPGKDAATYRAVGWHCVDVGDAAEQPALEQGFAGADAVVHLAWLSQPNHDRDLLRRTNVTGTAHVMAAARTAGVQHIVCVSSVGAYSRAPKNKRISESWPACGISQSHHSADKAGQKNLLNRFAAENPGVVVARLRPAVTFSAEAGSEVGRYFLGRALARIIPRKPSLPLLAILRVLVIQAVHAVDVADAYWRQRMDRHGGGLPHH